METLPDFWRTTTFHPLSVHFPIVLLLFAFLFKSISLFSTKETFKLGGSILLIAGTISAWIAIYTGNLADGIVSRKLCDPTVLKDHENFAFTTAWLFTAASVIDLFIHFKVLASLKKWINYLLILLLLGGTSCLFYVGHLGATLVYQQAAGVYTPSEHCEEF
ncbi:DUF2231 domain-containing protein [Mesonia maritima]|uniref:Membrane protein n=1 Tax=Mesonia maritima TaxID=1793873 RepID=A0ABU1K7A9_9FLAO|nr:DUF2231 domain-containing protein [Mesonia maritima]MDR6301507.1 putative membrane protein [Mesonia maritima]